MDDILRRISERLARPSSRRGLVAGLGKLVLGAAAAVAGQSLFSHVAEAAALMRCCDGQACADYVCPAGTSIKYTWSCDHYFCHDCFSDTQRNSRGHWQYICTYSVARPAPVRHRHVIHRITRTRSATPYETPSGGGGGGRML